MTDDNDGVRRPWGRPTAPGRSETAPYRLQTTTGSSTRQSPDAQDRSPRVGQHNIGAGAPLVPIALGLAALGLALAFQRGLISLDAGHGGGSAGQPKLSPVAQAERVIPAALRDPSIIFGRVWNPAPARVCGYLGSNNEDEGADKRFIYEGGDVRVDDGGKSFNAEWNARCAKPATHRHSRVEG
jgi:hypothetical protein